MTRRRTLRARRNRQVARTGRPEPAATPNLPAPWWQRQEQPSQFGGQEPQQQQPQQQQPYSPEAQHSVFMEGYNTALSDYERNKQRIYEEARQRAFREAAQGPYLAVVRQAGYREGYEVGLRDGEKTGMLKASNVDEFFTYSDVETARRSGFQEGVFVGRAQAKASEKVRRGEPEQFDRKKLINEMYDQCTVIAESNPSMASGAKAVRRMIKKLERK